MREKERIQAKKNEATLHMNIHTKKDVHTKVKKEHNKFRGFKFCVYITASYSISVEHSMYGHTYVIQIFCKIQQLLAA